MLKRRLFTAGLAAAPFARPALADEWAPSQPARMVVAYPAGGPTDAIARIAAADMAGHLGQQIVVDNVSGAAGAIGTRIVARAKPDGLTITFGNNQTHGNNMFMLKDPGYDAIKDFEPLAGAGAFEHVFVVRNGLPAKNIQDLIRLAKERPGALNFGSTGIGSGSHLATELFMARTGIKMIHVPYRGAAPLVQDIIGERIDVSDSTLPSILVQVQANTMRAIGISSPKRNSRLPDVPTLEEQGVTGANASSWAAFFAPAGTPQPILDRLSNEIMASLQRPAVIAKIDQLGFTIDLRDPAAFKPYLTQEIATWVKIAKDAGIEPDG